MPSQLVPSQQPEMSQLVEYILNPQPQDGVEWQPDDTTTTTASEQADEPAALAPAPEIEILRQISEIMQVVKEWVETQQQLITQVNTLEGKITTLIATTDQTSQKKRKAKAPVASKTPRRKAAKTSSYLEEE